MKSPRDILLERHRDAGPKLDDVRRRVIVDELNHKETTEQSWLARMPENIWQELIRPCRKVWAGLAVVWLGILLANVSMRSPGTAMAKKEPVSKETVIAFQQQKRLLEELIGPPEAGAAEPPKVVLPQPQSRRRDEWMAV